jgi:hypothetical protein
MKIAISTIVAMLLTAAPVLGQANSGGQRPRPRTPAATHNQTALPRGYVVFGGTYSGGANDFSRHSPLRTNAEDGSFDVDYSVERGPGVSLGAAARVWQQLGVRVGFTRSSASTPSTLDASVPHPFFFNRFRTTSATVDNLSREETALHLGVAGMLPAGRRGVLSVFAGPSWMRVSQDTVRSFTYSESYPFDDITFSQAATARGSGSTIGFGAGAEFSFFFGRMAGLAATAQFVRTTLDVDAGEGTTAITAGGLKAGIGLVFRIP